jgi:hypothetical protein
MPSVQIHCRKISSRRPVDVTAQPLAKAKSHPPSPRKLLIWPKAEVPLTLSDVQLWPIARQLVRCKEMFGVEVKADSISMASFERC